MGRKKSFQIYCADFETTSESQYKRDGFTKVYLWKIMEVNGNKESIGINIETFIDYIATLENNSVIYFHNLSFDGDFILWYLLEHEFTYDEELKLNNTFNSIIDETSSIYMIRIKMNDNTYEFRCSYKLFPKSINDIGVMVGIPKLKETHNYEEIKDYKSIDEVPQEEIDYITNDVRIMVELIKYLRDIDIKGLTMSSSAYKNWLKEKYFLCKKQMVKDDDEEIVEIVRKSYRGGITKVNPKYVNQEFNDVISFDVNSLYPSVMYDNPMPIGKGKIYKSIEEGRKDHRYLFIVVVIVHYAKVRTGKHAFIGSRSGFSYTRNYEYSDEIENRVLYLWYDEFRLFQLVYDGQYYISKCVGWKKANYVFKDYIDRWFEIKKNARSETERSLAKLMLNSLYGKFGMNDNRISKIPCGVGDGEIIYKTNDKNTTYYYKEIASYITSMARVKLASFINRCGDNFLYCDTDSVYYLGHEIPKLFEDVVDDKKLGYWKYEGHYIRFKALKAKCYIKQLDNGEIVRRVAGCPKECAELINFDNFDFGLTLVNAKHCKKKVDGGVIIGTTDFTIKLK